VKILLITLTLFLSFNVNATPMEVATTCTDNCPYPSELYKSDKAFAEALAGNLRTIGIKNAFTSTGALNGTESPIRSYKYNGDTVVTGTICASDCFTHFNFIYDVVTKTAASAYIEGNKATLMGNPPKDITNFLLKDENVATTTIAPLAPKEKSVQKDDSAKTIWDLKDNSGRLLGNVCNGKPGTCVIVMNTTNLVAVINHKSLNGCAMGDFYVVSRPEQFWSQYDTGTCSKDAIFAEGTMNNGQYRTIDVRLHGELVKQFPIEYWSLVKSFSGKNRPSWDKAKQNRQQ
ncbi:hypothetical protein AI2697V1_3737, partial [Enterobacter cloacae]